MTDTTTIDSERRAREQALWQGYLPRRDLEAEQALVLFYRGWVMSRTRAVAATWEPLPGLDMDDLTSIATMATLRCIRRWDPARGVRFLTFARKAADRAVRDALRRERVGQRHRINASRETYARARTRAGDGAMHHGEEEKLCTRLMRTLTRGQRELVRILFWEGANAKTAAERMGKQVDSVYEMKHRAILRMREATSA